MKNAASFVLILLGITPVFGGVIPESLDLAKTIKIADVHMHLMGGGGKDLIQKMNQGGVQWGGAVGGLRSDGTIRMKSALKNRYIGSLGQAEYQAVLKDKGETGLNDMADPRFVKLFEISEKMFADKSVKVFGEIHINNEKSGGGKGYRVNTYLTTPVVLKMYEIANRHDGFVQVHSDGIENLKDLHKIARDFPKTTTILAHCVPFSRPNNIREFFINDLNVVCELSGNGPIFNNSRVITSDGPRTEWLELIEEFPDRFMVGSDPCCGLAPRYNELVQALRDGLFPYLKPETLKKVAYQNAVRLFDLKD